MVGEVANFMHMYPAYKLRDVMDEYAVTFFALLNEGYRVIHQHYRMLTYIADFPANMDKSQREQFHKSLEWASTHPSDILSSSGAGSSPADIKKMLGG